MFKFDNYVDGAKPWVIASWCLTSLLAVCFFYTICAVIPVEFIPNMWPFNSYVALAVPLLVPICMVLNFVLNIWGGYMEVNNFQCASSKKYGSRFSFSLTIFFLFALFSTLLVVNGLIPETWIVSAYVYSSALSFILFWVFRWMIVKQFEAGWKERRLQNAKEKFMAFGAVLSCEENLFHDSYLKKWDCLYEKIKQSDNFEEIQKTLVATEYLLHALDKMDETLNPEASKSTS